MQAEEQAVKLMQHYKQKGKQESKELLEREHSISIIFSKSIEQQAIDQKIAEAFVVLEKSKEQFLASDRYIMLLKKLVQNAKDALGEDCTIYASSGDVKRIKGAGKIIPDDQLTNGIMAYSSDQKRYVRYTMESIIEDMHEQLIKQFTSKVL